MHTKEDMCMSDVDLTHASMIDKWILRRFNEVLENVTANMEKYEYALVGNELYSFVWDDFCSWYIELSKAGLFSDDETTRHASVSTLVTVFYVCCTHSCRLLQRRFIWRFHMIMKASI